MIQFPVFSSDFHYKKKSHPHGGCGWLFFFLEEIQELGLNLTSAFINHREYTEQHDPGDNRTFIIIR